MILKSLEFELPLFSLIFLTVLFVIYYTKNNVKIAENKYYGRILTFTLIEVAISTIVHFICATNDFSIINSYYYNFINFCNKIITTSFVAIFAYLLFYVLIISFTYIRKNERKISKYFSLSIIAFFILTFFTKVELVSFQNVTNVKGTTPLLGYVLLAILLTASSVISVTKIKSIDKRYYAIFIIVPLMIVGYLITIFIPNMIVYDVIITMLSYIMYFTIENPDLKLLEEVHKSKSISDTANEEKTMFLYNMTQEIRNTTGEINSSANEILDSNSIEENKDSARNIIATTSKFTSMTNEILDVSQIDNENIKTYNSKYDIKNTLKQIVNIYNEECKKKMLEFRTNIDQNIPENLYGDSISLKESLNKILRNSLNNTNTGYIEFNVNTIIKNDICRLIITIEDSGNGIRSEELNTIKKDNKLLSGANSLIGIMQGTLMISSDYGVGTKIKVILDQKIVDSEETKEVTKYVNTLDNINVLVCDTESGLKVISKLLDGSNVKLDKVDNGKELLESIKENKYDLVLMDESTSTNNQILVSKMRNVRNFNSEIILLTRDNSYEYNDEYKNLGFDDYILKPLKKDILLEKINKYKDN